LVQNNEFALQLKPDVVFRRLEGGGVLVDLSTNQIFELNDTGARVWELLNESPSPREAAEQLAREFDVDVDVAMRQLRDLIDTLVGEGLLV
jgi:hypothetical protein